jgi:hypothetical protein
VPPRIATEKLAVEALGEGFTINFGSGPCTIPADVMAAKRGFAEHVPQLERLALAPTGDIWAERTNASGRHSLPHRVPRP